MRPPLVYGRAGVSIDHTRAAYDQELAKAEAEYRDLAMWRTLPPPQVTAVAAVLGLDAGRLWDHVEGIHGWEPHDEGYETAVWEAAACTEHDTDLATADQEAGPGEHPSQAVSDRRGSCGGSGD